MSTSSSLACAALTFTILLGAPIGASAAGLSFDDNTSRSGFDVSVSGGTATLNVDHVCNDASYSQSVYLQIWYTTQASPSGSGYVGATFSIGTLAAGYCFTNIARSGSHTNPAAGTYYLHILATTSPSSGTFDDALTGSNTHTFGGGGGGGGTTPLTNGQTVTGLSGSAGSSRLFYLDVPNGASGLSFSTTGGTGDADLYVRYGSAPTTSSSDCASANNSSTETCNVTATAGRWYVLVYGYTSYSGVSLRGQYTAGGGGGGGGGTDELAFAGSVAYERSGGTVLMTAANICNNRTGGTSGTLYWRLRFTTQSSPVGDGYTAAEVALEPLAAGYCYTNLSRSVSFTAPPDGTYHVHFTLYEYPATTTIVDYVTFPNTDSISTPPPAAGGGAGEDGGGALSQATLLLLLISALRRKVISVAHAACVPGASAAAVLALLTACGGGGGDAPSSGAPACQVDGAEPNDATAGAPALAPESPVALNFCDDGTDMFALTVAPGDAYRVETFALDPATDTVLSVQRADTGAVLQEDDDDNLGSASALEFVAPPGVTQVIVKVSSKSATGPATAYSLKAVSLGTVGNFACQPDSLEPDLKNGTVFREVALGEAGVRNFCEDGEDKFVVAVQPGQSYVVETSDLALNTDTIVEVRDHTGTVLSWDDDGGGGLASRAGFLVPAGVTTATVSVTPFGGSAGIGDATQYTVRVRDAFEIIHHFGAPGGGAYPVAELIQASDGNLYGTTMGMEYGDRDEGVVFRVTPAGGYTVVAQLDGALNRIQEHSDGNFYGTTTNGGINRNGSIFRMTPTGTVSTIYSFSWSTNFSDPVVYGPLSGLVQGTDGQLYGASCYNDPNDTNYSVCGYGGLYRVTTAGSYTSLRVLTGPDGSLDAFGDGETTVGSDGHLYGVTRWGGPSNCGVFFRLTTAGVYTALGSFHGSTNGCVPHGPPRIGPDGNFYVATRIGGTGNQGAVVRITPAGALTRIHSFASSGNDARLVVGPDGAFYGITDLVPDDVASRVLYRLTTDGTFTALHVVGASVGYTATLTMAGDGRIYGTTEVVGQNNSGSIFRFTPPE